MKATIKTRTETVVHKEASGVVRLAGVDVPWFCRWQPAGRTWGHVHLHIEGKWLEAFWPAHERLAMVLKFAIKAYRSGELFGR